MKEKRLLKNKYDLQYQSLITLRNILWATALGSIIGFWNFLGGFGLGTPERAALTTGITLIPLISGLLSWKKAQRNLDR